MTRQFVCVVAILCSAGPVRAQSSVDAIPALGAAVTQHVVSEFVTTTALPMVLHEDAGYLQSGESGVWHRAGYAFGRTVVTRTRGGAPTVNLSQIGGAMLTAGLSAYIRPADRSATGVLTLWATQLLWHSASNELKEFWPDIQQRLHRPQMQ